MHGSNSAGEPVASGEIPGRNLEDLPQLN